MCFCAIAWVSNRSISITQYRCKTSMSSREGGLTFLLSFLDLYSGFNSAMCHHEPDRRDTWLTLMIIVGTQNIGNTRETARNCAEKGRHIVGEIVIMLRYFKSFCFNVQKTPEVSYTWILGVVVRSYREDPTHPLHKNHRSHSPNPCRKSYEGQGFRFLCDFMWFGPQLHDRHTIDVKFVPTCFVVKYSYMSKFLEP